MFALIVGVTAVSAQPLPKDTAIRVGHLPNGLTYYIRHNNQTPGQADFYIAQRVGSILEDKDQRGLAHFLEHMAFNGSEHFPDGNDGPRSVRSWCERQGIKFGADLNASTSIDRTIYNISNAPVAKSGVVDTCLLILCDWSHSLLLLDEEIDNERGIIHEEWRTRRSIMASQRIMEDAMSVMYHGSKYEDCLPIGSMDVVDNFPYDALRRYYEKWYRPDLQAVIVVGDIDVDDVEHKIHSLFSSVPSVDNVAQRIYYPVADNDEMVIFSKADSEQPTLYMQLFMKRDATPRGQRDSYTDFADDYKSRLAMFILRQRLAELLNTHKPAVMSCNVRNGRFYITDEKDALTITIGLKPDEPRAGIDAVMEVIQKARRYGVTDAELEHAKMQHNVNLEHRIDTKDKTTNLDYIGKIVNHFCNNRHLMSIEQEADVEHALMDSVTIDDVNQVLKDVIFEDTTGRNQIIVLYGPTVFNGQTYSMPSEQQLKDWVLEAEKRDYVNDIANTPIDRKFLKKLPKKGRILARNDFGNGYTQYVLSNGINVYARPSELEPNRLTIKMFRDGGRVLYGTEDIPSLTVLTNVINRSGAADFDYLMLEKKRAGKALRVTPFIRDEEEGIEGVCAASDFKTWLEVAYLFITQPRKDDKVFSSIIDRHRSMLMNRAASPMVVFYDSLRYAVYTNPERIEPLDLQSIDQVSHDRIMQIYKERFKNMAGMSLVVTGDIRTDEFEELICRYVASLPGKPSRSVTTKAPEENFVNYRRGSYTNVFEYQQQTPSALTELTYFADIPYTADNDLRLDVLSQMLKSVYTETVREQMSGVYGVSVSSQNWTKPVDGMSLTINFRCAPDNYLSILNEVILQLHNLAANGPTEELLQNIKEYERKYYNRIILTNGWWEYVCYHKLADGVDFNDSYLERIDALTTQDIQSLCQTIIDAGNRIQVTMK